MAAGSGGRQITGTFRTISKNKKKNNNNSNDKMMSQSFIVTSILKSLLC